MSGRTRTSSDEPSKEMLGIEDSHWSLYLHTGRSPLDGLDWLDEGGGSFSAKAKTGQDYRFELSDLDLYLMALAEAAEVAPWFVIREPKDCVIDEQPRDCPAAASRPFLFGEVGLPGNAIRVRGVREERERRRQVDGPEAGRGPPGAERRAREGGGCELEPPSPWEAIRRGVGMASPAA